MNWLFGDAGTGKTTLLIERAQDALKANKRVWWIGLPNQRNYIYQRITNNGAVLGLEFMTQQQLYYRLLAAARGLQRLLISTGRIATVGRALAEYNAYQQQHHQKDSGVTLPSTGEARLFTRAIAEAKRFGMNPKRMRALATSADTAETRRFAAVFERYERIKGEQWDYDDFRSQALALLEDNPISPDIEADVLIVDGFRELGPLELRIYQALAKDKTVWLALPEPPPKLQPEQFVQLERRYPVQHTVYRADNPVAETRWLLRALKRDLAEGMRPADIGVIMPAQRVSALLSLADEYHLPLMNEIPSSLADTLGGRLLLDLLELPDYPTASRLLAIPELHGLAKVALERRLSGREALSSLAAELDMLTVWQSWLADLETPKDVLAWAEKLLRDMIPAILGDVPENWQRDSKLMLERAKEAESLTQEGESFRAWWAGLIQESFSFERRPAGIALMSAKLAAGRRFKKVYLLNATEGTYSAAEKEDYFFSEELRQPLEQVYQHYGLPKRFQGRDDAVHAELLARADHVIISYPQADQGGQLVAEPSLTNLGVEVQPLPSIPAGSVLELGQGEAFQAQGGKLEAKGISVSNLRRYARCPFQYWAEKRLQSGTMPPWRKFINQLQDWQQLNLARLDILKTEYPEFAGWLHQHQETLLALRFGVRLPNNHAPFVWLDAATRQASTAKIYHFTAPERISNEAQADDYIYQRWAEVWVAGHMLKYHAKDVKKVEIYVWSLGSDAMLAKIMARPNNWNTRKVEAAYEQYETGDMSPQPGFHCRECGVADFCREGSR